MDIVYSGEADAWNKFLAAWKTYDIVMYTGHANSGQFFDISSAEEHKGEPKNGYKVLYQSVGDKSIVKFYESSSCYPEMPYGLLNSATRRIAKNIKGMNAVGHRESCPRSLANTTVINIVRRVIDEGKSVEGAVVKGLDVLPHLTAHDIGTDDGISDDVRKQRYDAFDATGATLIWHNIGDRKGYGAASKEDKSVYFFYTEQELVRGAQGKLLADGFWDDVQVKPLGTTGLSPETVVVSVGTNTYLETVAMGDDTYEDGSQTHSQQHMEIRAGPNGTVDTTTIGGEQLWQKFLMEIEGVSLSSLEILFLKTTLLDDERTGKNNFQKIIRLSRE